VYLASLQTTTHALISSSTAMACLGHHGDQEGEYSDSLETVVQSSRAHAHERHQYFGLPRRLDAPCASQQFPIPIVSPFLDQRGGVLCALRRWMEAMIIVIAGVRTSARQSGGCRRQTCRLERLVDVLMRAGLASTNSALACCTAYAPPLHFALGTLGPCFGECAWRCCETPRR